MDITIAPLHVVALELDINAVVLEINYPLVIGHVKIYGLEEEIDKDVLRIENVSGQDVEVVRGQDAGQDAGQDVSQEDVDLVRGQEVDRLEDQEVVRGQDVSQEDVDLVRGQEDVDLVRGQDVSQDVVDNNFSDLGIF